MERERGRAAGSERRASPRLDKAFQVYVEGERGSAFGVARNISEGGMFVETRDPPPLGSQVRITFSSGAGEMKAVGEIRYVCHLIGRPSEDAERHAAVRGMGVRFLYFEAAGTVPRVLH
jgi:hypothetical protein